MVETEGVSSGGAKGAIAGSDLMRGRFPGDLDRAEMGPPCLDTFLPPPPFPFVVSTSTGYKSAASIQAATRGRLQPDTPIVLRPAPPCRRTHYPPLSAVFGWRRLPHGDSPPWKKQSKTCYRHQHRHHRCPLLWRRQYQAMFKSRKRSPTHHHRQRASSACRTRSSPSSSPSP